MGRPQGRPFVSEAVAAQVAAHAFAEVAQSVEHGTENAGVPSSSLGLGTQADDPPAWARR